MLCDKVTVSKFDAVSYLKVILDHDKWIDFDVHETLEVPQSQGSDTNKGFRRAQSVFQFQVWCVVPKGESGKKPIVLFVPAFHSIVRNIQ